MRAHERKSVKKTYGCLTLPEGEMMRAFMFYAIYTVEEFNGNEFFLNDIIEKRRIRTCPHCNQQFFVDTALPRVEWLCPATGKTFDVFLDVNHPAEFSPQIQTFPRQMELAFT